MIKYHSFQIEREIKQRGVITMNPSKKNFLLRALVDCIGAMLPYQSASANNATEDSYESKVRGITGSSYLSDRDKLDAIEAVNEEYKDPQNNISHYTPREVTCAQTLCVLAAATAVSVIALFGSDDE